MKVYNKNNSPARSFEKETILLVLLPFWTPQIPPLGIACLKSFLQSNGCKVKTADANTEDEFKNIAEEYFHILKALVPEDRQGNFYSVGQDVFRNHMMAHLNYTREADYLELVRTLVFKTFYVEIDNQHIEKLNALLSEFYRKFGNYFIDLLEKEKPGILGLSVFEGTLPASLFAFKLTREKKPHIMTVMGGGVFANQLALGSPNLDFFLEKTPYIDKIIIGEGEILFLKLLRGELLSSRRVFTLEDITGEVLDIAGKNPCIPDFSDFNLHHYPYLVSYSSRSCPYRCSFCSETIQWGKYRKKRPRQVVEELKKISHKYRRQLFLMGDSLLNPVIGDLASQLIEEDVSIYWDGYLRVDKEVCDTVNTQLWRQAGFYRARLGVESGSSHVLELMGKKVSPDQVREAIYSLAYAGIKTTTYWVVGHPGETEADFRETLDLLAYLRDHIYEAWCSPFYYYLTGQVNSAEWAGKSVLLYPPDAKDMLIVQTWILEEEPNRKEAYDRMNRFADHCRGLGIPNPYSMMDFYKADERWKKLHRNAVPSLVEFEDRNVYIDEHKRLKKRVKVQKKLQDEITFGLDSP